MEFGDLTSKLSFIALIKQGLPFTMRGWVSVLGLHVQERRAGGISRLQAGGKFRSYFDAWKEEEEYRIRKFDPAAWEQRFAHLVDPTTDVVSFLANLASAGDEPPKEALVHLSQAAQIFERTGNWIGLPGAMVQNNSIDERVDAIMQYLGHIPIMAVQELEKLPEVLALVHHGEASRLSDGTLWAVSTLYREAAKEASRDFRLLSRDGAEIMLEAVRSHISHMTENLCQ